MAMAGAAGHGPHCVVDVAASSGGDGVLLGRAAAVRTTAIVTIGRRPARLGCSGSGLEAEAVSSSYSSSCRIPRMTITRSSRGRQDAIRSRKQSDVVRADAITSGEEEEEVMGSFWDRLQLAWRVLIGVPNEAQATKKRFSRLLVRDRGFNSANLSRLYNAAKGAIKEHVELEGDEDTEVTAIVDRLGELRLDFRVKRVKSVLRDEPFSDAVLPEMEPSLSISGGHLWEGTRAPHDTQVRTGVTLDECLSNSSLPGVEPRLSINGDQLWEYNNAPLDLKARLGFALDRPSPSSVVSDGEPVVSTSGGLLWEDSRTSQDLEDVMGGALEEPFPMSVRTEVPSRSIRDHLWKDSRAPQEVGPSNLKSPRVKPIMSIRGDHLLANKRAAQDIDVRVGEASNLMSTMVVDSEGEWYTFSFPEETIGELIGATNVDGDFEKQL